MSHELHITPSREEFCDLARTRRSICVFARVVSDTFTPIGVYRRLARPGEGGFLLESAEVDGTWSRYSIIGVRSDLRLESWRGKARWIGQVPAEIPEQGPVFDVLNSALKVLGEQPQPGLPPFAGGFVGHVAYDAVRETEEIADSGADLLDVPDVSLGLASDVVVMDHRDGTAWLIACAINHDGGPERAPQAYDEAYARVEAMYMALVEHPTGQNGDAVGPVPAPESVQVPAAVYDDHARYDFDRAVGRLHDAIVDGEVFQTVISQRFSVPLAATPLSVYRALRSANPSPYMFIVSGNGQRGPYHVVGASPEALVRVTGARVVTHPIAGTRPRSGDFARDRERAEDLLADAKERSEHVMLVDLARNDLGKVCVPGSVEVTQFMGIQHFSHVMHMVSEVAGTLKPEYSGVNALTATFPAGTLSGAPKPRAMQLIDELEPVRRGVYGGVVGYFALSGDVDVAIAIRSAVLSQGRAYVQAGAGVVADSSAASEDAECRAKAGAVLKALAQAHHFEQPQPFQQHRQGAS